MADDDLGEVWLRTVLTVDGKAYVVVLEASEDVLVTLTPDRVLRHASGILAAAHRAAYDSAVLRQITRKLKMDKMTAARLVADMRADRPPLDPADTAPLWLEPGVNNALDPFLTVYVNEKRVGQWSVKDAEQHALTALAMVSVADLDSGYHRTLLGILGSTDKKRARRVIADLVNYRDPE